MSVGVAVVLLVFFRCAGPLCLVGSGVYALSLVTGHAVLRGMVASVGNTARVAVGVEALFYVSCCVFATVVSRTAAQPPHLSRSRRREIWRALLEDPHFSATEFASQWFFIPGVHERRRKRLQEQIAMARRDAAQHGSSTGATAGDRATDGVGTGVGAGVGELKLAAQEQTRSSVIADTTATSLALRDGSGGVGERVALTIATQAPALAPAPTPVPAPAPAPLPRVRFEQLHLDDVEEWLSWGLFGSTRDAISKAQFDELRHRIADLETAAGQALRPPRNPHRFDVDRHRSRVKHLKRLQFHNKLKRLSRRAQRRRLERRAHADADDDGDVAAIDEGWDSAAGSGGERLDEIAVTSRMQVESMRLHSEPLRWQHRPLAYYAISQGVGSILTRVLMGRAGYVAERQQELRYFYRPPADSAAGDGASRKALVFIHGIGVGPAPYLHFVQRAAREGAAVIVVELGAVAQRISAAPPSAPRFAQLLRQALRRHGLESAVVAGHSLGSAYAVYAHRHAPSLVSSLVLIDPIACQMHHPSLIDYFFYALPYSTASLLEEYYIRRELFTSYVISRHIWWWEAACWLGDMSAAKPTLVCLSEDDAIVNADGLRAYWDRPEAKARGVRVLALEGVGHGAWLANERAREALAAAIRELP